MKKILFATVFAAVLAVSCNKIDELVSPSLPEGPIAFKASIGDLTKTSLNGLKTNWVEGDAISIYGTAEHGYYFAADASGATATFNPSGSETIESGLVASEPYALYPYYYESTFSGGVIGTYIDENQRPVVGNFPSNQKPLLVAKADADANLAFRQVTSVVKFTLTDASITSVKFQGNDNEYLSGMVKINAASGNAVIDTEADWIKSDVILANEDNSALATGTYYLVVAPTLFENGITLFWEPSVSGKDNWKSTTQTVEAKAGHILNLGTVGYSDADTGAPTVEQISATAVTLDGASVNYTVQFKVTDDKALKSITLKGWKYFDDYAHIIVDSDGYTVDENTLQGTDEYTISYDLTLTQTGTYKFWVTAYDRAGNAYDAECGWVTVGSSDATPPEITYFSEYNVTLTAGNTKDITVTATDNENLASITCRLYDSSWANILDEEVITVSGTTGSVDYTLDYATPGSYVFAAFATDAAGKESAWWNTNVTIVAPTSDTTPPSITLVSATTATTGTTYNLQVNFADPSGITACYPQIYVYDSTWAKYPTLVGSLPSGYWTNSGAANWGTTVSGTNFTFALPLTFSSADTYYVYIYGAVSDSQGNSTAAGQSLIGTITVTQPGGA